MSPTQYKEHAEHQSNKIGAPKVKMISPPAKVRVNFLKFPFFNSQRLALRQNGVEFHQKFTGVIRNSLIASYDVERPNR